MSTLDASYAKFDELDFSSDEDDCHPNIEINTWRRLKARMREEKGIVKKEPLIFDKWNTTKVNAKKTKYDITGQGNDDTHNNNNNSNNSNDDNNDTTTNESKEQSDQPVLDTVVDTVRNDDTDDIVTTEMRKDDRLKDSSKKPPTASKDTSNDTVTTGTTGTNEQTNNETQSQTKLNNENAIKTSKKAPKVDNNNESSERGNLFEARSDPKIFLDEYLPKIKKFAKMKSDDKADEFISQYYDLVHEATEGYIITFAVDRAVEGATQKQLAKYAKRCLTIHNLIQSCQSANVAPKVGVSLFFKKMENPQVKAMYRMELEKQCAELLGRIEVRRKQRLAEAEEAYARGELDDNVEYVEEKAPLGPGGLDPTEVLNSLPKKMQEAFISRNIDELRQCLAELPIEEAQMHMQRCIDSGLWVDNADDEIDNTQSQQPTQQQATVTTGVDEVD